MLICSTSRSGPTRMTTATGPTPTTTSTTASSSRMGHPTRATPMRDRTTL
jgi:hypothetical protein